MKLRYFALDLVKAVVYAAYPSNEFTRRTTSAMLLPSGTLFLANHRDQLPLRVMCSAWKTKNAND